MGPPADDRDVAAASIQDCRTCPSIARASFVVLPTHRVCSGDLFLAELVRVVPESVAAAVVIPIAVAIVPLLEPELSRARLLGVRLRGRLDVLELHVLGSDDDGVALHLLAELDGLILDDVIEHAEIALELRHDAAAP